MIRINKLLVRTTLLLITAPWLIACTAHVNQKNEYISPFRNMNNTGYPKSVIILPFENETDEADIEKLIRKSFYNHFSSKNYRDFELNETDLMLEVLEKQTSQSWKDKSSRELAEYFHTDFLVYGKAKEYKKLFLGIYSQIALRVYVEIIDGKNGDIVFSKNLLKRSHDGGLPFSPLSVIPATVRSGIHMTEDNTIELIDRIIKEIVELIPDQAIPPVNPRFVDIQIASFQDDERAKRVVEEFISMGLTPRIETVMLNNRQWHRVLLGPYFNLAEAKEIIEDITRDNRFKPIIIDHNNGEDSL